MVQQTVSGWSLPTSKRNFILQSSLQRDRITPKCYFRINLIGTLKGACSLNVNYFPAQFQSLCQHGLSEDMMFSYLCNENLCRGDS